MSIGYLYTTWNYVDDIGYVGQSGRLDPVSIQKYLGSGDIMRQAIEEHGEAAFKKEILGYFDRQVDLDYAEIHQLAILRDAGQPLYNSGVGGPRAESHFRRAMFKEFGVMPQMFTEWLQVITDHEEAVKDILQNLEAPSNEDFYRELEQQYKVTQNLTSACPRCSAGAGEVCRTKTGNPARNHAARPPKA